MTTPVSDLCPSCFASLAGEGAPCGVCGFRGVEPQPRKDGELALGALLRDRYSIGRVLGRGGFGITYLAWDTRLRRRRAIKEYFPRGVVTREVTRAAVSVVSGQTQLYAVGMEKYLEEARLLAQFEDHPCIVSPLDFFEENSTAYLVMEYLEGETLRSYVARCGGRIPYATALQVLLPVIEALATVHRAGILHRDVSPDNIFLTVKGEAKLLDFGAARQRLTDSSASMTVILREHYAPPEQYTKTGRQGTWTDVYAFAATFYMAITGQSPPPAPERLLHDRIEWPSHVGVSMPPVAEQALMAALAVRIEERPQQIEALTLALQGRTPEGVASAQDRGPTLADRLNLLAASLRASVRRHAGVLAAAMTPQRTRAAALAIALGVVVGGAGAGIWRWVASGPSAEVLESERTPRPEGEPVVRIPEPPSDAITGRLPETAERALPAGDEEPAEDEVVDIPVPKPAPDGPQLPGLIVRSALVDDQLFIDGKPTGSTGSTVHFLEPGTHLIRVVKDGYRPFEAKVEIVRGAPVQTLRAELKLDGDGLRERFEAARAKLAGPDSEGWRAGFAQLLAVAELGYAPAQSELASVLAEGRGKEVPADNAASLRWLGKAAEQGDVSAQYLLGLRLEFGGRLPEGGSSDKAPSPVVQAKGRWIVRVFRSDADFRTLLQSHTTGGDAGQLKEAFGWHMKAAERGHAGAQERVAYMLAAGRGTARNPAEAFYYLLKSAIGGRSDAQYAVGMCYLLGEGYAANPEAGTCWLREAARQGHERARAQLVQMKVADAPVPAKAKATEKGPACNYAPIIVR